MCYLVGLGFHLKKTVTPAWPEPIFFSGCPNSEMVTIPIIRSHTRNIFLLWCDRFGLLKKTLYLSLSVF
jgi:hypothetical protein